MKPVARRTSAAVAVTATAGVSTLFVGVSPAYANPEACGPVGTVVGSGVCELVFTESGEFTPTAQMTQLEVLLVGAGGNGQSGIGSTGYAAGGGGEVRVVDISGATDPLTVTVPTPGVAGGVAGGGVNETVANGENGTVTEGTATGGASGNGNPGASVAGDPEVPAPSYGGGGGAGGAATGANGGAGVVVGSIAPGGSLFAGDDRCFGGGGAVEAAGNTGIPGCGGGSVTDGTWSEPVPNSGGGAAVLTDESSPFGAAGSVIFRWAAANVTLTFDVNGHGTAPDPQVLPAGTVPTEPADPTDSSYHFDGWFADEALTVPADFSAPITVSTTFYAKWSRTLPATGVDLGPVPFAAGITVLVGGLGLAVVARLKRREN